MLADKLVIKLKRSKEDDGYKTFSIRVREDIVEKIDKIFINMYLQEVRQLVKHNNNFLWANTLPADSDNDSVADSSEWITPEDIHQMFVGVPHTISKSKNNMKPKGNKPAVPRNHVFFAIDPETDQESYAALKKLLHKHYPFFDPKALDVGRYVDGTENPDAEFYPGTIRKLGERGPLLYRKEVMCDAVSYRNQEGYADPTVFYAFSQIEKEQKKFITGFLYLWVELMIGVTLLPCASRATHGFMQRMENGLRRIRNISTKNKYKFGIIYIKIGKIVV